MGSTMAAACDIGETIAPINDGSVFSASGGSAVIQNQILTYTGVTLGDSGALVGPGAAPSVAPTPTLAAGTGLGAGAYQYAYTDVTAAGESLPSPLATVTTGNTAAPSSTPTVGAASGAGVDAGSHDYQVTFVTASGETTPSSTSTQAVVGPPSVAPSWAAGPTWPSGSHTPMTNASLKYSFLYSGGAESAPSAASNLANIGSTQGWSATIPTGGTGVIGRRVYMDEGFGGGYSVYQDLNDNTTTAIANISQADTNFYIFLQFSGSPAGSAVFQQIPLTAIPTGSAAVTSRKLYRRFNGSGTFKLVTTIANNTATTYTDTVANASLGAAAPSSNTAIAKQVSLSAIATGPTGTTSRKVYRTAVGASQLKLLTTLGDNTTTTYADSTADASLGANAPTSDTSALAQPSGQVIAGATSLILSGAGAFSATGGWARVNNQVIRYTGITGNTLTGIPTSGAGAIKATISYNATVLVCPALTGIPSSSTGSIAIALVSGDEINLLVQRDDATSQATYGIRQYYVQDRRLSITGAQARGDAELTLRKDPYIEGSYITTDTKVRSGRRVPISLASEWGISGTYTISKVRVFWDPDHKVPVREVTFSSNAGANDLYRLLRRIQEQQQVAA
jgi:hypothetical protein